LRALIGDLVDGPLRGVAIERVLDFGCGEGSTTEYLACKLPGARVLRRRPVGQRHRQREVDVRRANLEFRHEPSDVEFGDARFDLVTCFEVLEHVEDWQAARPPPAGATRANPAGVLPDREECAASRCNVGTMHNFRPGEFEFVAWSASFPTRFQLYYAGFPFYSPLFATLAS